MQKGAIRSIAIVGDGKMGRSIFAHLLKYPFQLTWINISSPDSDKTKLLKKLKRLTDNGLMTEDQYNQKITSVHITSALHSIEGSDLLIEAIPENQTLKSELFTQTEQYLHEDSIITSNSSSILPQEFAISESMKGRFAGLHFFYPVETNALLEIIPHPEMQYTYVQQLEQLAHTTEKYAIVQDTKSAFACNRFFLEIQASLYCYCVDHGIDFRQADEAIQNTLFPAGIFTMMEHIGFPILEASVENYLLTAISHHETNRFYEALKLLNINGFNRFPFHEFTMNNETGRMIVDVVNSLFINFAKEYIQRGLFTHEQLRTVIREYTGSDYSVI